MQLTAAAVSHVGTRREENQDCLLIGGKVSVGNETLLTAMGNAEGRLFAVFDGMGGHAGGAMASRIAALHVGHHWQGNPAQLPPLISAAGQMITRLGSAMWPNLGTTVVALAIANGIAHICSVGDSPAYQVANGLVGELTEPDTRPDPRSPQHTLLTQCLGPQTPNPSVHNYAIPISDPKRFVLASDGLDAALAPDLRRQLLSLKTPQDCIEECLRTAAATGAPDNITIIVLDVEPSPIGERDAYQF